MTSFIVFKLVRKQTLLKCDSCSEEMLKGNSLINGNILNDDWRGLGWSDNSKTKKRARKDIKDKVALQKPFGTWTGKYQEPHSFPWTVYLGSSSLEKTWLLIYLSQWVQIRLGAGGSGQGKLTHWVDWEWEVLPSLTLEPLLYIK